MKWGGWPLYKVVLVIFIKNIAGSFDFTITVLICISTTSTMTTIISSISMIMTVAVKVDHPML